MSLATGARLGPYEILGPIGAGGMGEVYRARDERLAREVAIKVLPAGLAHDPERMRRFEHEAKAVGSLNHPHILAVYDTGRHDGSPYVVSELLEGQTLRERMAGGALPLRKTIEIAVQIARGLAAAHEKGIVHRDLKPENVFVTNDGLVKILDFGLAKLMEIEAGDKSESPTQTRQTAPGVVLGTAPYMSPEQVRGAAVDHRSDIFSFGTILYEMLTGKRAFKKETLAETMAAILREDPPDLMETNPALPPVLGRIVAHCLEKNPHERFASARDLAFDLESLSDKSGPTTPRVLGGAARPGRRALLAAGLLATLAAAAAAAFGVGRRTSDRPQPKYHQLSFGRGYAWPARFSPDGATVLYSARWNGAPARIFSLRLDLQIEQPLGFEGLLVGVAAGELAFLRSGGTLLRAPLAGGGVREVAKDVALADWSNDGTRFAITRRAGAKYVLEYPIRTVLHDTVGRFGLIRISPDGARVAFTENPSSGGAGGWIGIADATGVKRLTKDPLLIPTSLAWSPDGKEVWFTATTTGRKDFSVYAVSPSGSLREMLRTGHNPELQATFRDGRALLSLGQFRQEVAGLAPGESVERNLSLRGLSWSGDLAEDGRRYVISDEVDNMRKQWAFVGHMDGAPLIRLGEGSPNSISPDGRSVLAWKDSAEGFGTGFAVLPMGAGEPRDVPRGTVRLYLDARFLPDGRRLLLSASEQDRPRRLFVQDLPDGVPKPITPEGVFTEYAFTTPDGAWVPAGSDYEASPYLLYPIDGGEPRPIPGLEKGDQPIRFSADGRRLFVRYGQQDWTKARIALLDLTTGRKQPWKVLSPADPAGVAAVSYAYVTPDGRAYVYNYNRTLSDLFLVEGLK